MARRAELALDGRHGDHAALFEDLLVARQHRLLDTRGFAHAFARQPRQFRVQRLPFGVQTGPADLSVPTRIRERLLGRLDLRRDDVGRFEQNENLFLDRVLLGLGGRDLVEQRREFLVGLDGCLVVFEAGQPAVDDRDLLLELAARVLVLREPCLRGVNGLRRGSDRRVNRLLRSGNSPSRRRAASAAVSSCCSAMSAAS